MKQYQHIFFDFDRTIWDFEKNSEVALSKLYHEYNLEKRLKVGFQEFLASYKIQNDLLWKDYRLGKVLKDELRQARFYNTFEKFGLKDKDLAMRYNDDYVIHASSQTHLIPGAKEVLDYLYPHYQLHIITNGFLEAQETKLDACDLRKYFKQIIISDGLGFKKPDQRIFTHAMDLANATAANSLMIGDDYGPDVLGAKSVGMDQVYLEWIKVEDNQANFTIHSLFELKGIL